MSSIYDSLSSIFSLTSQINALKKQQASNNSARQQSDSFDPSAAIYEMQRNFNEMLNNLISSSDEEKNKEKSDPFAFLTDYQNSINLLNNPISQNNTANNASLNIDSYTGSIENSNLNQNNAQYNLLTEQYKLNLDNIF